MNMPQNPQTILSQIQPTKPKNELQNNKALNEKYNNNNSQK